MHLAIIVPLFEFLVAPSWKILLKIPHLLRSNPDVCVCACVSPTYPLPLELLYRTHKCRKEKCVSAILNLLLGGWLAVSSRQLLLSSFRQKSAEEAGWTSEYCVRQKANITVPQSFQELCGHECFFFFAETPQMLADFPKVSGTHLCKDVPIWHTWPAWHSLEKHVQYQ